MASLPTRIRQNIRDQFESEECELVFSTKCLEKTLGYPIAIDPEWTMLWSCLQAFYTDPSTFVPTIVAIVVAWCDALNTWLENEEYEKNVEKLLDAFQLKRRLEVVIEISESTKRPTTTWKATTSNFVITLPKATLPDGPKAWGMFSTDLLNLFTAPSPSSQLLSPLEKSNTEKSNTGKDIEDSEGWADLGHGSSENNPIVELRGNEEEADLLPDLSTIARPEELTKKPPYWLVVSREGRQRLIVQGSHAKSLECLGEYLKRWCRTDTSRVDRPPMVGITLHESAFGLGLLQDTLTLEAIRGKEVNAMLVLVFVERVLGYSLVSSNGSVWEFKRTKPFK